MAELKDRRGAWIAVSPLDRRRLVRELRRDIARVADRWAAAVAKAEGLDPNEAAEAWLTGPYITLRQLRFFERSLRGIARHGVPRIPGGIVTLPDGRVSARVVPFDRFDRVMYRGVTADVWMQPGVTAEEARRFASRSPRFSQRCNPKRFGYFKSRLFANWIELARTSCERPDGYLAGVVFC